MWQAGRVSPALPRSVRFYGKDRMFGSFDFDCEPYEIRSSSIGHGANGYVFRCTIRPVADDVLSGLADAARLGTTIRLLFPSRPLLLERVDIRRVDRLGIRVIGHIVDVQPRGTIL